MSIEKRDYYNGEWYIKDISEEQHTFGWLTLNCYSELMEEDVEIASTIADDIDVEEMIETFNVISKANEMHNLLEECYLKLEDNNLKNKIKELLERDLKIRKNL